MVRPEQLRDIGLFGGLTDESIASLVAVLKVEQIEPGATVMREGEAAREMFVVLGGELEVLKKGAHGNEARVAMLGPGDWVGEMSIIDVMPRSATVRSLAPSLLLKITADDLDKLYRSDVKSYALFVLNMARELSRRLRVADGILAGVIASVCDEYLGAGRRSSMPGGSGARRECPESLLRGELLVQRSAAGLHGFHDDPCGLFDRPAGHFNHWPLRVLAKDSFSVLEFFAHVLA